MSYIQKMLFIACLLVTNLTFASSIPSFNDSDFNQDRLMVTTHNIMAVSSFSDQDHITAYNEYGTCLWDVTFYPKVLSWKLKDGRLYVFSKSRLLEKSYITCMDPATGVILWERP